MEKSSFFNDVSGDRVYRAEEWAEYFSSFIGNGVFPVPSHNIQVVAGSGMAVTVKAGKAWINGYLYFNTADLNVILGTADGVLNRIDRLVLRWDLTDRSITVRVKPSTAASNPNAPALQRNADAYEMAIADVFIRAGSTAVLQSDITDQRFNSSLCGIVTGTVEEIDASVITAQFNNFFELYRELITDEYNAYASCVSGHEKNAAEDYEVFIATMEGYEVSAKADFEAWFSKIQGVLSGDIAGKLTLDVEDLQRRVTELEAIVENTEVYTAPAWLANSYLGCAYLSTATN